MAVPNQGTRGASNGSYPHREGGIVSRQKKQTSTVEPVTIEVLAFESLTEDEERDLLHLERKVERAVFEGGKALKEIRDRRLYRSTHKTFEAYCRDRFGHTRQKSNYLISASEVVEVLTTNCCQTLPTAESQVRPLTKLEADDQLLGWSQAVEEAGGKIPSARIVKDVVRRIQERTPVPNPWKVGDVCTIVVKDNPDLRGKGGCWAIVSEVHQFSCTVRTGYGDCQVRIENLKELILSPGQRQEVEALCDRLNRLREVEEIDRGAYPILESLAKQLFLTSLEEKLLKLLEEELEID